MSRYNVREDDVQHIVERQGEKSATPIGFVYKKTANPRDIIVRIIAEDIMLAEIGAIRQSMKERAEAIVAEILPKRD